VTENAAKLLAEQTANEIATRALAYFFINSVTSF
jgi:hypothetical protein